jgi:hypothetical protein
MLTKCTVDSNRNHRQVLVESDAVSDRLAGCAAGIVVELFGSGARVLAICKCVYVAGLVAACCSVQNDTGDSLQIGSMLTSMVLAEDMNLTSDKISMRNLLGSVVRVAIHRLLLGSERLSVVVHHFQV